MKAEIISIGTELLLGTITDTNATYLAQRLADLGIDCYYVCQVGDNQMRIVETLQRAVDRSDLVITTGGLGPTGDDLTRESIAALLGEIPYAVPELEDGLRSFFSRRGISMPDRNLKQATLIPSAHILRNPIGTAPGWRVTCSTPEGPHYIISMPGVPYEMKRMWQHEVEPWLRPQCTTILVSRTLKLLGLGESTIDEAVSDLMVGNNPTLAPYAKQDGVHLRITAKAETESEARTLIAPVEAEIRRRFGEAVYGADDEGPAEVTKALLAKSGLQLAILEVGPGAISSVSNGLSDYSLLRAAVVIPSNADGGHLFDELGDAPALPDVAHALLRKSGADLVLAVSVDLTPLAEGDSVRARAECLVLSSTENDLSTLQTANSVWNTAKAEVARLVGLSAINLLRRWLLARTEAIGESGAA